MCQRILIKFGDLVKMGNWNRVKAIRVPRVTETYEKWVNTGWLRGLLSVMVQILTNVTGN